MVDCAMCLEKGIIAHVSVCMAAARGLAFTGRIKRQRPVLFSDRTAAARQLVCTRFTRCGRRRCSQIVLSTHLYLDCVPRKV